MNLIQTRHTEAISEIDDWLQGLELLVERLPQSALSRRGFGRFSEGWSMPLPIDGGGSMLLLLDSRFPYSVPRIAVLERDDILLWPHVEHNGLLCIAGDNANVSTCQPLEIVRSTLCEAESLLQQNERGELTDDYLIDFQAYWRRNIDPAESAIYSITDQVDQSRIVSAWHGQTGYWVGETPDDLLGWIENRNGETPEGKTKSAGLIKLSRLPEPAEYPTTVVQLRHMLAHLSYRGLNVLDQLLQQEPQRVVVLLEGLTATDEKASAGLIIHAANSPRSKSNRVQEPLSKGFRPGRVPGKILATRYSLRRAQVTALDSSRSRIDPSISSVIASKKVAIIGCGSVGASVARILVQSGVNNLILVDPERLGWENIGRHELGAQYVGNCKAGALEKHLRRNFPHVKYIHTVNKDFVGAIAEDSQLFEGCDLIISATADWNSESALNDMQIEGEIHCPIIYSWLEEKAAAAHALVIFKENRGCFACGFGATGKANMPATRWPEAQADLQCGGGVSVYGSAELANSHALTASLSIDVLTNKVLETTRRVWISGNAALLQYGGSWNQDWLRAYGEPEKFGQTVETDWEASRECVSCRKSKG
jgi:molybdopterin/thiamine biosynthesis adenylyltransferase|tara:strand:+ start:9422 stop:11206 length:1785 start_codon:yes stop_codon:yes gene_type:complete